MVPEEGAWRTQKEIAVAILSREEVDEQVGLFNPCKNGPDLANRETPVHQTVLAWKFGVEKKQTWACTCTIR